ncbi:uncharacterized protein TNCV_1139891 [Trichonephila clavipes]|nr:uncharacterized protein TNCV_1139891 [Trichonephila clavipes]
MYIHTLHDALFIGYKQSFDDARSIPFSRRTSSPHLIIDETFNDRDIINNLIDYEDGQEEPDKTYAGIQLSNQLEKHFLKICTNPERSLKFQKELQLCISGSHPGVSQKPPTNLTRGLAARRLLRVPPCSECTYKQPCLLQDSNPGYMAQQSAVLTTIPDGRKGRGTPLNSAIELVSEGFLLDSNLDFERDSRVGSPLSLYHTMVDLATWQEALSS